jgi:VIT1/CCC1 family predicted Fe2+/Mn2+ transporter
LSLHGPSPWRAAASTLAAFVGVGFLPLLAFFYQWLVPNGVRNPFGWSALMTGAAFFVVGALKGRFVEQRWYWSGFETLAVGGVAAALAYVVGLLLKGLA